MKNIIQILLRFDDICPTMNWEQWNKAKQLMDKTGVTALLGVIPECKDPDLMIDAPRGDFWEYIKDLQSQGYTIAMHGYQHIFDIQASGIVTPKKHSEFAGHPYEIQYEKIKKGKEILQCHGVNTDVFFAPAHSYDDNTLKALAANGFKYISDGKSIKPYSRNGIICIPARSGGIPKIKERGYYTVVLHAHEWLRPEKNEAWVKLKEICSMYANQIVSFDEFRRRSCGNSFVQKIDEILYVFFWNKIAPYLIRVKYLIKF